jgi:hypothetical protein
MPLPDANGVEVVPDFAADQLGIIGQRVERQETSRSAGCRAPQRRSATPSSRLPSSASPYSGTALPLQQVYSGQVDHRVAFAKSQF